MIDAAHRNRTQTRSGGLQQGNLAFRHDVENGLAQYRLGAFEGLRPLFDGDLFHQSLERGWRLATED
ncbi:hypothetical protein D3C80_2110140 [compost metagenome]